MANIAFAWPNFLMPTVSVTPTVSVPGGSGWIDLPNLFGDVLSEMARCPSADTAKTKLVFDMGTTRAVQLIGAPVNNLTIGDKVRARLATDVGFTDVVLDSGWTEAIGRWYPFGSLPWGHPRFWDGYPTAEDLDGYCPPWRYIAPAEVLGRYLELSFDIGTNPAGYLDVGRVTAGPLTRPRYNVSYGLQWGIADGSDKRRLPGGAIFADRRTKYRTLKAQLDWLSVGEAFGQYFELQRHVGKTEPFFMVYDSDDDVSLSVRRSFMASFVSLEPIAHPSFGRYTMAATLEEHL